MKKLLSVMLSIILSMTLISCSNKNGTSDTSENKQTNGNSSASDTDISEDRESENAEAAALPDEAAERIEAVWSEYLKAAEIKCRSAEWATEHILSFCRERDVSSYRRAVAALESAAAALDGITLPELQFTEEETSAAMKYGVDVSYIGSRYSSLASEAKQSAAVFRNLLIYFFNNSLWEYGLEYIELAAEFNNSKAKLEIEELILSTNLVLLTVGRDSYGEALKKDCASLFTDATVFIDNIPETEFKIDACLDNYEKLTKKLSELESTILANDNILSDAIQTNDWSEFYSEAVTISDGINAVFLPETTADYTVASYFYKADTETLQWTVAGDDLSEIPTGLVITYTDVTQQTFEQYIDTLEMTWWEEYSSDTADGKSQYMMTNGLNIICVSFKDGTLKILISDADTYICPTWYILYLLS